MRQLQVIMCSQSLLFFLFITLTMATPAAETRDYKIQPIPFTSVQISDSFWLPRLNTSREQTIPFALNQCEETGRLDNFLKASGELEGEHEGERYNDSDVYKSIEGASYLLSVANDPELESYLDRIIEQIAAAQESDGYLFTPRTINPENPKPGTGKDRWSNIDVSHELYNVGHLYEAAVAFYRATGKKTLLDVALKNADLILREFGPGKRSGAPGHQEIELGLVKLFRVTGQKKYLDLAKFFLDQRGRPHTFKRYPPGSRFAIYNDPVQIQYHLPVTEQTEAVGHAVRAGYMYSAMADVAALTADPDYLKAVDRLWLNVINRKIYLTGGIGASHQGESFAPDYELPNRTAYNETCAAIANAMWNQRMFLLHGDGKYIDTLEKIIYNGIISGVSLDGKLFFYPNPLESDGLFKFNKGAATRKPWFGVACCPGNVARFMPSFPGYIYAASGNQIYVNLYVGSRLDLELQGGAVGLIQETEYPWKGAVNITVSRSKAEPFSINLRIPGWTQNRPLPGSLYSYIDSSDVKPALSVDNQPIFPQTKQGYVSITRKWREGDTIQLKLPMPVRRVLAHGNVRANRGKTALERGPLVYCFEGIDNQGKVMERVIDDSQVFNPVFRPDFLGGVVTLEAVIGKDERLTAIPYYAWSHRGPGEMAVWLTRKIKK